MTAAQFIERACDQSGRRLWQTRCTCTNGSGAEHFAHPARRAVHSPELHRSGSSRASSRTSSASHSGRWAYSCRAGRPKERMTTNTFTCRACHIEFELTLLRIDAIGVFSVCPYCGIETAYKNPDSDKDRRLPSIEYPGSRRTH
jgi:hypothetical protein